MNKDIVQIAGLVAGLFFPLASSATTFGPITVYQQAQNAAYYVHARVESAAKVRPAPHINRPYTYWNVQVSEQLLGDPIPSTLEIRQPGGEIGDNGYHVAGSADFTPGEEVFLALHDTDEAQDVKEVVGLASGKYTVTPGKDGQSVVVSGLGLPVSGPGGVFLQPSEFSALLRRISAGQATDADKNIFVSQRPMHEHHADEPEITAHGSVPKSTPSPERSPAESRSDTVASASNTATVTATNPGNPVQQSPSPAEESSTGSSSWGWVIALGVLVGLGIGLVIALRR